MENMYYGITFPKEFSVEEDIKRQFARLLFFHPKIPFESVRSFVSNSDLLGKVSLVIKEFGCSISGIEPVGLEDPDEMSEKERFFGKLLLWIREFAFPTEEELRDLADYHLIPVETIVMFIIIALEEDEFSRERILDFLAKYSSSLPQNRIDKALDLYNKRRNSVRNEILDMILLNRDS